MAFAPLITDRLLLRSIEERDREPFAEMNRDQDVMRYFASTLTGEESNAAVERYRQQTERDGFSFLTLERRESGQYLGILGMQTMRTVVPGLPQPAVEIGWRLVKQGHGYGYATEGARAVVAYAFQVLRLPQVVAITAAGNRASRRVMEKLGMLQRPESTFEHPQIPEGHPHRQHVLYTLANPNG